MFKASAPLGFTLLFLMHCGIADPPQQKAADVINTEVDHLEIISGNGQSGLVNTPLTEPLVVAAIDKDGQPLVGSKVSFKVESGSLSLGSGEAQTDSAGKVAISAQYGTVAGAIRVKATLLPDPNGNTDRSIFLDLTSQRDAPARLVVTKGKSETNICAKDDWVAKVSDQYDNGIPGVVVTVDPTNIQINNQAIQTKLTTDSNGYVAFTTTAPTVVGNSSILLTGPSGLTKQMDFPVKRDFRFEALPGFDNTTNPGTPIQLTLTLRDGCGPIPSQTIQWLNAGSSCQGPLLLLDATLGATRTLDSNGAYLFQWGPYTNSPYTQCYEARADDGTDTTIVRIIFRNT